MATAVDKWPAFARLSAVAQAGHLPAAPTPPLGIRPCVVRPEDVIARIDAIAGTVGVDLGHDVSSKRSDI
jgi:hypothetical protein